MSKYTTLLRWVVEQELTSQGAKLEKVNWPLCYARLGLAKDGIVYGLTGYPVESEATRQRINDKIIQHYYMREIGAETIAQFALRLNETMHLIMPYYNSLFNEKIIDASHLIAENYNETVKVLEDITGSASGSGTGSANSTSGDDYTGRRLDTPQARIQNLDDGWLTSAEKTSSSGTAESTSESTSKTNSQSDRNRADDKVGTHYDPTMYKQLLTIGRELLNIDRMIVEDDEVSSCFMMIW